MKFYLKLQKVLQNVHIALDSIRPFEIMSCGVVRDWLKYLNLDVYSVKEFDLCF